MPVQQVNTQYPTSTSDTPPVDAQVSTNAPQTVQETGAASSAAPQQPTDGMDSGGPPTFISRDELPPTVGDDGKAKIDRALEVLGEMGVEGQEAIKQTVEDFKKDPSKFNSPEAFL